MKALYDMMDYNIAEELGVDVETYIELIENKCSAEDANFIIMTLLTDDTDNLEKAKETFNKYLNEQNGN